MKKLIISYILIVTFVFLLGCEQSKTQLTDNKVIEIKQSIIDTYFSEDEIKPKLDQVSFYYYGTFNNYVVIMRLSILQARRVGSDIFGIYYPNTYYIEIWKDGQFYRLEESQKLGLLTDATLKTIAKIHKSDFEEIYDSNYWK